MTSVLVPLLHTGKPLFKVPYSSICEVWRNVRFVLTNEARGRLVGGGTPCTLTTMWPEVPWDAQRYTTQIPALFPVLLGKAPHSAFVYSLVKVSFHFVPSDLVGVRDYQTVGVFVHCEGSSVAEAYVKQLLKCAVAAREPTACFPECSSELAEEVQFWFPDLKLEPEVGAWCASAGAGAGSGAGGGTLSFEQSDQLDRLMHMIGCWKLDLEGGRAVADICCAILTACNNGTAESVKVLSRHLHGIMHKVAVDRTGTHVGVLAAMAACRLSLHVGESPLRGVPPLGSAPAEKVGASAPTPKIVLDEQRMWYDLQRAVCADAALV
jgi:hypothetical protein